MKNTVGVKKAIPFVLVGFLLAFRFGTAYANSEIVGKYKSLNGEIEHHFSDSGDYTGIGHFEKATKTYQGVYRFSPGLCWLPSPNGLKGPTGNVVIHYDEQQCCLRFENVSDKVAVTYVWSKPYEHIGPFGICSSQVLKRINSTDD